MTTDDVEGEFMGSGAIGLFSSAYGLCKSFHSLLKAWMASYFVIELLVFFACLHRNKFYARDMQIFSQSVAFFIFN